MAFGRPIGVNQGVVVPDRRPRRHGRGGAAAHLQGGLAQGRAGAGRRSVAEVKQAAAIAKLYSTEAAVTRHPHRHPGLRRQRLHGGVPRGPVLPRRQDPRDRRGHLARCSAWSSPAASACRRERREPESAVDAGHGTGPGRRRPATSPTCRARLGDARAATASRRAAREGAAKLAGQHKLYVRDRIALLFDEGSFVEDGRYANALAHGLPADGVVTGRGAGRRPARRSSSPTTRPSRPGPGARAPSRRSSGPPRRRCARSCRSSGSSTRAGARITDQVELFPGRRGAGRIFHNQVALSGKVPQICCLFGPSAAGGAYIPAFTDIVIMVEGNASMYLGSARGWPRWSSARRSRWRRWAAPGCTAPSRACGDLLAADDAEAIELAQAATSPTCRRAGGPAAVLRCRRSRPRR